MKKDLFNPLECPLTTFDLLRITMSIIDVQEKGIALSPKKMEWVDPHKEVGDQPHEKGEKVSPTSYKGIMAWPS